VKNQKVNSVPASTPVPYIRSQAAKKQVLVFKNRFEVCEAPSLVLISEVCCELRAHKIIGPSSFGEINFELYVKSVLK
jgi:hypothetical protein